MEAVFWKALSLKFETIEECADSVVSLDESENQSKVECSKQSSYSYSVNEVLFGRPLPELLTSLFHKKKKQLSH